MTKTPLTDHLFDEEIGRTIALDRHYKYYKRVREEMSNIELSLSQARDERDRLAAEVESLRAFKRGVDEALNMGDGSYRP